MSASRRQQLEEGLAAVRARIDAAAQAAGREPAGLTLVVVTKTFPASDVRLLHGLGVREVGESRDQEASAKAAELADLIPPDGLDGLRWHFVGRLQSNKARSVAGYAHVVHSLDRPSLVAPLGRGAREAGRELACFVQVSLDDDPGRGGVPGTGLDALADAVAAEEGLRLVGAMAVAPQGADPDSAFARLRGLADRLRERHPGADRVSAGMSGDLEAAVRHGATHLRVGSAVLGNRPHPG